MFQRIGTIIGGGFFSAAIFAMFGAPTKWQWLAAATGSFITFVMLFDRGRPAKPKEATDAPPN